MKTYLVFVSRLDGIGMGERAGWSLSEMRRWHRESSGARLRRYLQNNRIRAERRPVPTTAELLAHGYAIMSSIAHLAPGRAHATYNGPIRRYSGALWILYQNQPVRVIHEGNCEFTEEPCK